MIELRHIKKEYEYSAPLKDINLVINRGDVISVIGPSGTGKTTLLRCIAALEKPDSGDILIEGVNPADKKATTKMLINKVGMVFQGFNLYPHLNVLENVMAPQIHVLKRSRQEAYDRAIEQLKQVGMFEKLQNYPDELSGGQKQRVAIARTLAMDTDIILFDEPTSALDPTMVGEVEYVIRQLGKLGKTMMIVTHEMGFAKRVANRVLFMCDGIVYEDGTPEQIFEAPQKEKTIEFINLTSKEEIIITSRYFDFPEAVRKLEMFAEKAHMSSRQTNTLQLLFEEAVMQLLMPALKDEIRIRVLLSFSEKTEEAEISIFSNCPCKVLNDRSDDSSSLPLTLIGAMVKECTEELADTGGGYSHSIRMVF